MVVCATSGAGLYLLELMIAGTEITAAHISSAPKSGLAVSTHAAEACGISNAATTAIIATSEFDPDFTKRYMK